MQEPVFSSITFKFRLAQPFEVPFIPEIENYEVFK